jgi:hypothetical protein
VKRFTPWDGDPQTEPLYADEELQDMADAAGENKFEIENDK